MELKKQHNTFTDEYWKVLATYGKLIPNTKLSKYGKIFCHEPYAEDLSKLYGGCILPYNILKDEESITFTEGVSTIKYSHNTSHQLTDRLVT